MINIITGITICLIVYFYWTNTIMDIILVGLAILNLAIGICLLNDWAKSITKRLKNIEDRLTYNGTFRI